MAEVPHDRDDLQKNFGEDHGGPYVQIHTATVEVPHHRAQKPKVAMASLPDGGANGRGMRVRRVRADGYVNRYRHPGAVCLLQQAGGRETAVRDALQTAAKGFAESDLASAFVDRFVHLAASLLGRAETAVGEHGFDILARLAGDGDLEIVDGRGAVQSEGGRETAMHEVDQDGR